MHLPYGHHTDPGGIFYSTSELNCMTRPTRSRLCKFDSYQLRFPIRPHHLHQARFALAGVGHTNVRLIIAL